MSKSFFNKEEYHWNDLEDLMSNEIEESINLDYKSARSLDKSDRKKKEIAKDVSAFANSDGGIIIYGIVEENHKPQEIDFVDGNDLTKEWLENVIDGNIQQRILDILIYPIRKNNDLQKTVYIVKIPPSVNAPHISSDNKYYKRYNFKSVPMEEYEVRMLYNRESGAQMDFCRVSTLNRGHEKAHDGDIRVNIEIQIEVQNISKVIEKNCKIEVTFQNITELGMSFSYERNACISHKFSKEKSYILTSYNNSPIFPDEEYLIIKFNVAIRRNAISDFKEKAVMEVKLFDSTGTTEDKYEMNELISENKYLQ